jgi:hypothetical protein
VKFKGSDNIGFKVEAEDLPDFTIALRVTPVTEPSHDDDGPSYSSSFVTSIGESFEWAMDYIGRMERVLKKCVKRNTLTYEYEAIGEVFDGEKIGPRTIRIFPILCSRSTGSCFDLCRDGRVANRELSHDDYDLGIEIHLESRLKAKCESGISPFVDANVFVSRDNENPNYIQVVVSSEVTPVFQGEMEIRNCVSAAETLWKTFRELFELSLVPAHSIEQPEIEGKRILRVIRTPGSQPMEFVLWFRHHLNGNYIERFQVNYDGPCYSRFVDV